MSQQSQSKNSSVLTNAASMDDESSFSISSTTEDASCTLDNTSENLGNLSSASITSSTSNTGTSTRDTSTVKANTTDTVMMSVESTATSSTTRTNSNINVTTSISNFTVSFDGFSNSVTESHSQGTLSDYETNYSKSSTSIDKVANKSGTLKYDNESFDNTSAISTISNEDGLVASTTNTLLEASLSPLPGKQSTSSISSFDVTYTVDESPDLSFAFSSVSSSTSNESEPLQYTNTTSVSAASTVTKTSTNIIPQKNMTSSSGKSTATISPGKNTNTVQTAINMSSSPTSSARRGTDVTTKKLLSAGSGLTLTSFRRSHGGTIRSLMRDKKGSKDDLKISHLSPITASGAANVKTASAEEEKSMRKLRDMYLRKASFFTSRNRLEEALLVYEEACEKFPNDSDLLNCKGVCLKNMHKLTKAMECYKQAIYADNNNASAWNNEGVIYKEKDDYTNAIHCYVAALAIDPLHKTARTNLAVVLTDMGTKLKLEGRHDDAIMKYFEAIRKDRTYSPCYYNLGVIYSEMGNYHKAMVNYELAIQYNPRYVEAYNNMGAIYKNLGQLDNAIENYIKALKINPNFEMSRGNLAVALTDKGTQVKTKGDIKEGIRLYKQALMYNPHYPDAYYNLGVAYGEQFMYDKALWRYQLAVKFNPKCAEAYNNLGVIYKDKENLDKAIYYYKKALEVNPNFSQTLNNIGVIYTVVGKMIEAHEYTRRAIEANPHYAEAYNNLGVLYRDQGDVELALESYEKCIAIDPNSRNALQNRLLALNYLGTVPVEKTYEASLEWGNKFISQRAPYFSWKNDYMNFSLKNFEANNNKNRLLRIGYVSPDLFTHSVSYFIHGPLVHHNRKKVHVVVYSNVVKEDDKTQMFKNLAHEWKNVVNVPDYEVARMIYEDNIDVLVELAGHTANNRLDVLAYKPAPVQVTWIGYPNTTGLRTVDYRITDPIVDPIDTTQPYVEKLYRLPDCFLCYTPLQDLPDIPQKPPCIDNQFVTFGSFNNLAKIGPQVVKLWSRVLCGVPNSRLLVKAKPFATYSIQQRFMKKFEEHGVDPDRLDLMPLIPVCSDHLKTYGLMDIALDTFPYAGTTTTCESLLMGVPIIVLKTKSNHAHNVGVTLLQNIGCPELIANNEDEFVRIAVQLGLDFERVRGYRQVIRPNMLNSPLCDGARFAKNLERAYADMYNTYCEHMKKKNKILADAPKKVENVSSSGAKVGKVKATGVKKSSTGVVRGKERVKKSVGGTLLPAAEKTFSTAVNATANFIGNVELNTKRIIKAPSGIQGPVSDNNSSTTKKKVEISEGEKKQSKKK